MAINMTHSEIRHIMNVLRKGTIAWEGRRQCLARQRKRVFDRIGVKGQEIFKYHWQCAECEEWFRNERDLEVDHIVEIGGFTGDWGEMVLKIYCRQDNLRALCTTCHLKKTKQFNSAASRYERKPER